MLIASFGKSVRTFPFQHWTSCICRLLSRLFIFPAPPFLIFSTSIILKPGRIHIKRKWVNDFKKSWFRVEVSVKQWVKQFYCSFAILLWKAMESLCALTSERHWHDYLSFYLHSIRIKWRNIHPLKDMAWGQKGSKGFHCVTQWEGRLLLLKTALQNSSWKPLLETTLPVFPLHVWFTSLLKNKEK